MKAYEDYFAQGQPGLPLDRAMPPAPNRTKDAQLSMTWADWDTIDSAELATDGTGVVPTPSYLIGPNSLLRGMKDYMLSIETRAKGEGGRGEYFIEAEKSALVGVIGCLALPPYIRPFLSVDPNATKPGLLVCYKNEATAPDVAGKGSLLYDDFRLDSRVCIARPRGKKQELEAYRFSGRIASIDRVSERPKWVRALLGAL